MRTENGSQKNKEFSAQKSRKPTTLAQAVKRASRSPEISKVCVGLLCVAVAGAAPYATAEVFPAEFELSSLVSGDGSA